MCWQHYECHCRGYERPNIDWLPGGTFRASVKNTRTGKSCGARLKTFISAGWSEMQIEAISGQIHGHAVIGCYVSR